jgi:hypothetical protein
MRLYYVSFFYFNIVFFFCIFLRIDLFILIFFFFRKTYSIFKESFTEYFFQEFDGLRKEGQILDLYENKLYVDFGLDAGLEEFYIQSLYMQYALFDISLDFEAYNGTFTFKWNDFNLEELNIKKERKLNFKKAYFDLFFTDLYYFKNIKNNNINSGIHDDDYLNIYNYKNLNRREIEEPLFNEDNEKYYFSFLKIYFLKENFYDTFISDNYIRMINYNKFINDLKNKVLIKKYKKEYNKFNLKNYTSHIDLSDNILQIKKELKNKSFIIK